MTAWRRNLLSEPGNPGWRVVLDRVEGGFSLGLWPVNADRDVRARPVFLADDVAGKVMRELARELDPLASTQVPESYVVSSLRSSLEAAEIRIRELEVGLGEALDLIEASES